MFSYEDRLRAVKLYIKLGKRIGLTIRQLGYPTKKSARQNSCNPHEHWLCGVNADGQNSQERIQ